MTPEEHQLIVCMLQQQQVQIATVIERLKERKLLAEGDFEHALLTLDPHKKKLIAESVEETYRVFAQALGVAVPEFPPDAL